MMQNSLKSELENIENKLKKEDGNKKKEIII